MLQAALFRAVAKHLLALNNAVLELVFHGECLDVSRGRDLALALHGGEVRHISLQRITNRTVLKDQLPGKLNFRFGNLV